MANIKLNIHTMLENHTVKATTRANIVAINIVTKHMEKDIKVITATDQNVITVRGMVITENMTIINTAIMTIMITGAIVILTIL
jgi:hypothetical protein